MNQKNFKDEEFPHELFLTAKQTTKIRNAFANNMSTDIKLSQAQISKIIQSSGSFGFWLGSLRKKALTNVAFPLARENLPGLVSNLTSSAINKFAKKVSGKGAVRAGKGFTLFILNEDINNISIIIESLEDSGVLIDGVTETVKDEIKKTRKQISWSFVSSFSRFSRLIMILGVERWWGAFPAGFADISFVSIVLVLFFSILTPWLPPQKVTFHISL